MRLIDGEKLTNIIREVCEEYIKDPDVVKIKDLLVKMIDISPTVDAVPVVHGKWERTTSDVECSNCYYPMDYITPYCPNCGAKMDLKEDD